MNEITKLVGADQPFRLWTVHENATAEDFPHKAHLSMRNMTLSTADIYYHKVLACN